MRSGRMDGLARLERGSLRQRAAKNAGSRATQAPVDPRLGQLFAAIAASRPSLAPQSRAVADFVLENWELAAAWRGKDVAQACGVSRAVVSRFGQKIGLSGFSELQSRLCSVRFGAKAVRPCTPPRVPALRSVGDRSAAEQVREVAANHARYLAEWTQLLDGESVEAAALHLWHARDTYLVGFGETLPIAHYWAHLLQELDRPTHVVIGDVDVQSGALNGVGQEDLVVVLAFARHNAEVLSCIQLAGRRGAGLIAITDTALSQLGREASVRLLIPAWEQGSHVGTAVGTHLCEVLAVAVAQLMAGEPSSTASVPGT